MKMFLPYFIALCPILGEAQSQQDMETVIQMAFDLKEFQHLLEKAAIELPPIVIDKGIVPNTLNLTLFNQPVQFRTREWMFERDINRYIQFEQFSISPYEANLRFRYIGIAISVEASFEIFEGSWVIRTQRIGKF